MNISPSLGEKAASRENNFDFLRFFAASQVILYHTFVLSGRYSGPFWKAYDFLFKDSGLGVSIFFVISGFLIMKSRLENRSLPAFLRKRFLRIAPALAVAILFCVLFIGPLTTSLDLGDYFASLMSLKPHLPRVLEKNHVPNMVNGSLWTLKVEAFAYVLVALVGFLSLRRLGLALTASFISLFVFNFVMLDSPGYFETKVWSIYLYLSVKCLIMFNAGVLFYLYREKITLNFYVFLFLVSVMFLTQRAEYFETSMYLTLPYAVLYFAYSKAPLQNWGRFGDFSYGLYIFAFPVQQALLYFWSERLGNLEFFLFAFSLTLVLAVLSWRLIEKPALRLKGVRMASLFQKAKLA